MNIKSKKKNIKNTLFPIITPQKLNPKAPKKNSVKSKPAKVSSFITELNRG